MNRDVGSDTQTLTMARHLVERMAPEELDLFEETAVAVGRRPPRSGRRGDDPLGFGVAEVSGLLFTTVACGVAREVLESLAKEAGKTAAGRISSWLRIRRRADTAPAARGSATHDPDMSPAAPLSPATLDELRGVAQRRAVLLGLPPERAGILANSVVEYLAGAAGSQA